MDWLSAIGAWITDNESLLSGLAALIVVIGVVVSPLGVGLRRLSGASASRRSDERAMPTATGSQAPPESLPATPAVSEAVAGPSIAVLPFENMSDDNEQAYLADGMTEDLITGLAAMHGLKVTARNSTFAYKGLSPDIREVGRNLGVRYVLEGSMRRVGEKIRVTAQLIEAETGNHLWADKYDRLFAEIFEVQDEVVGDIASALSLQITHAEVLRARTVPPSNMEAWELVTQATHSHFRQSPARDGNESMLETLRQAVELDEDYAYARAAYAWMLASSAINGWATDHVATIKEAFAQLQAAMELDVTDSLSRYYVGAALLYTGDFARATRYLKKSLEQNPHQPDTMVHLGLAWAYCQDFAKAHEFFHRAARLGTAESHGGFYAWYEGIALCLEDRYEESVPILQEVIDHFGNYQTPKLLLGIVFEMMGQPDKASAVIQRAHDMDPGLNLDGLCGNFGAHFDREKGRQRVAILRKYWPTAS